MYLAPSASNFRDKGISNEELLQFFDSGRNLYFGLNSMTKYFGRDMFKEFGAQLYPLKSVVSGGSGVEIEGVSTDELSFSSNINEEAKKRIVEVSGDIAYLGSGMKIDPANEYIFPLLKGTKDMKAKIPSKIKGKQVETNIYGEDIVLVSGYQSRYSQRAVLSGSIEMCSDKFIKATQTGKSLTTSPNYQFCIETLRWNFQQKSVLKMENFSHSLVDKSLVERGLQKEQEYKLKDEIQVSFDLYEKVDNKWVPFHTDDVSFEFIMLHPWAIETLKNTKGAHYRVQFHVPDHNGVYKFKLDYNKLGLSRVYYEEIAPVRVNNHDEFPTYAFSAYPYFASVYIIIAAFVLFTVSYIMTSDQKVKKVKID